MSDAEAAIAERYRLMSPHLNERQRRRFAATEARTFGRGGIAAAARACVIGVRDDPEPLAVERVRSEGAGRKPVVEHQRLLGRVQIQPDDVGQLLGELGSLESLNERTVNALPGSGPSSPPRSSR